MAHGEVISLSGLMTAVLAATLPAAHIVGRAIKEMPSDGGGRSTFYFLHRLGRQRSGRIEGSRRTVWTIDRCLGCDTRLSVRREGS